MRYLLLIITLVLSFWTVLFVCIKIWLDYRAYKFVSTEIDENSTLNSYDEVFYTRNNKNFPQL
jgi:predicted tellurium resistance membrane protein TerC